MEERKKKQQPFQFDIEIIGQSAMMYKLLLSFFVFFFIFIYQIHTSRVRGWVYVFFFTQSKHNTHAFSIRIALTSRTYVAPLLSYYTLKKKS